MKRARRPSTVGRRGARNELGARGEALAADFLLRNGYEILKRNWQGWWGEIDVLARKDGVIVVVEVKTRTRLGGDFDPRHGLAGKRLGMLRKLSAASQTYQGQAVRYAFMVCHQETCSGITFAD